MRFVGPLCVSTLVLISKSRQFQWCNVFVTWMMEKVMARAEYLTGKSIDECLNNYYRSLYVHFDVLFANVSLPPTCRFFLYVLLRFKKPLTQLNNRFNHFAIVAVNKFSSFKAVICPLQRTKAIFQFLIWSIENIYFLN